MLKRFPEYGNMLKMLYTCYKTQKYVLFQYEEKKKTVICCPGASLFIL